MGALLIRQGQYALALLEADPCHVPGCRAAHPPRVEMDGDVLPGAVPLVLVDMLLLVAGCRPPGLVIGSVVEP